MKKTVPFLLLFVFSNFAFSEEDISALYQEAIKYYNESKYTTAIQYWKRILEIDPHQIPPKKLIEIARQKMQKELKPLLHSFTGFYQKGRYKTTVQVAVKILDIDPANEEIRKKKEKLEKIIPFFEEATGKGKFWKTLRIGINAYLNDQPDVVLDAVIYASQINTDSKNAGKIQKLVSFFEKLYPEERAKIKLIAGMNLINQRLQSALDSIYKADYTGAIMECNRVLKIDPNNTLALMRKGSAYYALKKYSQAERNWEKVLKIDPNNKEVKKFLKALRRARRKK